MLTEILHCRKKSKMKLYLLIYAVFCCLVFCLSLGIFYIFKPYTYIDNAKFTLICKNGNRYAGGWNFIYTFEDKLDSFNDIKARKICQYNAIKDYGNGLKTPDDVNYRFAPIFTQESSWPDAIFMFFAALIIGTIFIEALTPIFFSKLSKKQSPMIFIISFIVLVPLLFFLIIKKPADIIFCSRQVARKVNSFKRIIFKYGLYEIPEEDSHINSLIDPLYQKCLKSQDSSLF